MVIFRFHWATKIPYIDKLFKQRLSFKPRLKRLSQFIAGQIFKRVIINDIRQLSIRIKILWMVKQDSESSDIKIIQKQFHIKRPSIIHTDEYIFKELAHIVSI